MSNCNNTYYFHFHGTVNTNIINNANTVNVYSSDNITSRCNSNSGIGTHQHPDNHQRQCNKGVGGFKKFKSNGSEDEWRSASQFFYSYIGAMRTLITHQWYRVSPTVNSVNKTILQCSSGIHTALTKTMMFTSNKIIRMMENLWALLKEQILWVLWAWTIYQFITLGIIAVKILSRSCPILIPILFLIQCIIRWLNTTALCIKFFHNTEHLLVGNIRLYIVSFSFYPLMQLKHLFFHFILWGREEIKRCECQPDINVITIWLDFHVFAWCNETCIDACALSYL